MSSPRALPSVPVRHAALLAELENTRRFARKLVRDHHGSGADFDDLEAEAILGAVEASSRYDASRGAGLATYAWLRMRGRIVEAQRRTRRETALATELLERPLEAGGMRSDRLRDAIDAEALVRRVEPELRTDERIVLQEVHLRGRGLHEVGRERGWSPQQSARRNRALLARLRADVVGRDAERAGRQESIG
ncbi:MAG: hypothetical protein RIT45_228 [Pseudomonadota bacterium]|jgi:RNA polymerase sigma factor (sigma-70 family)